MIKLINKKQTQYEKSGARAAAFWALGSEVYEVDTKHINFVREKPEIFDLTSEEIRDVYKKHGEKIGLEGKARAEIMHNLLKNGWLRIRHYVRPQDMWIIEFDKFMSRKKSIHRFIDWALDHAGMDLKDSLSLQGTDDHFYANYTFQDGGVQKFYFDEKISGKSYFQNKKLLEAEKDPVVLSMERQIKELEMDILDLEKSKIGRDKDQQSAIDEEIKEIKDDIADLKNQISQRQSGARAGEADAAGSEKSEE